MPVALSRDEVVALLKQLTGTERLIVMVLYGSGVRLEECRGFGRVVLPFALDRKYPNAPAEWGWQFVFPAGRICRDPRFGPPSRYHVHPSVVQKAVARAARLAGTTKRLSPHVMRSVSA